MNCPKCDKEIGKLWDCDGEESYVCVACELNIMIVPMGAKELDDYKEELGIEAEE